MAAYDAKRVFNQAKKEGFRAFCDSLTPETNMKKVWRTVKAFKKRFLTNQNQVENNSPLDNIEAQNYFKELGITSSYNLDFLEDYKSQQSHEEHMGHLNENISTQEIIASINKTKKGKSPGADDIPYEVPQRFSLKIIEWLRDFYNLVLDNYKTPIAWNTYKVSLIPKPNNSSYRPIALSCTFLKLLERIICDRLMWHSESKGLIPKNFFGFRFGKSCEDCFLIAKVEKHYMGIIFIDIKGAFNYVNI